MDFRSVRELTQKTAPIVSMIFLLFAIIAIAGCQPQQVVPSQAEKSPVASPKPVVAPTDDEPAPTSSVEAPAQADTRVPTKRVRDLLAKQGTKVKSMTYMYQDPLNNPKKDRYYVKGDKVKIELSDVDFVSGDIYVNRIYLNRAAKDAVGYCEANVYRCVDPNKGYPVPFGKYDRKTPIDWVNGVTYAEETGSETVDNREASVLTFDFGSAPARMWIDTYYGIPLKVELTQGSRVDKYIFEDAAFNTVSDDQLVHQNVVNAYVR